MEQKQNEKQKRGRPASDPKNPINKLVRFKATQQQAAKLSDIAKAEGVTTGEILRTALTEYLEKTGSVVEHT